MSDSKPTPGESTAGKPSSAKSSLEKSNSGQPFPDLYRLLSLRSLETDRSQIEAALRRLAAQIKSSQLADDGDNATTRKAKLLELGKLHLLSTERKKQYDQQWQRFYGGAATKPVETQTASKDAGNELLSNMLYDSNSWLMERVTSQPAKFEDSVEESFSKN